ncbi:MAG: hypothetical protein HY594_00980 [Candidatus Omnitrophica bacterium]|nr:hypothetical protein [Candidatus Omnitrophota bacterium]
MKRLKRTLAGIGVGALLALAYTDQQIALIEAGYAIEQRAQLKADMLDQHRILLSNVLTLQAPQLLEQRLARRDVEWVVPSRVAWLPSSPSSLVVAKPGAPGLLERGRRLFARMLTPRATAEAQPVP